MPTARTFTVAHAPAHDVAIVLGASPGRLLGYRIDAACALVALGKVQRVLLTGTPAEIAVMRPRLSPLLAPERLHIDDAARRTLDNLVHARDRFGIAAALVITQRFHLPRALALADAVGLQAVGVEAEGEPLPWLAARERVARVRALFDAALARRR